jgi:hypothetical protein
LEKTMTSITQLAPSTYDLLDEEALIKEARVLSRSRRRRRGLLVITLVAAACLIVVGVDRFAPATASSGHNDASGSAVAITCPNALVKLLGVTSIPGAAVTAGILVRASVSTSVACAMSGYPTVQARLTNLSTAVAGDERTGIFGGLPVSPKSNSAFPRIPITSHPRVVSFTVEFISGNGPSCPRIDSVQLSLPGSPLNISTRTMREGGRVGSQPLGIYCGYLYVTPLVKGSSGTS